MKKESLSGTAETGGEIILFGVRVKVDPMRKSVSMNNLSQYEHPDITHNEEAKAAVEDSGYASADDGLPSSAAGRCLKERKRGVPWTEEEHKLFLLGLQKVGKGDWRGISRNFVKSRTPTQVASHAQKYFLRRNNLNRRRRRSSLFDITTDSVPGMPMDECNDQQDNLPAPETHSMASNVSVFPATPFQVHFGQMMLPVPVQTRVETTTFKKVDLSLNHRLEMESTQLSLGLSLSSGQAQSGQGQSLSTGQSTFHLMPRFNHGESIISVS